MASQGIGKVTALIGRKPSEDALSASTVGPSDHGAALEQTQKHLHERSRLREVGGGCVHVIAQLHPKPIFDEEPNGGATKRDAFAQRLRTNRALEQLKQELIRDKRLPLGMKRTATSMRALLRCTRTIDRGMQRQEERVSHAQVRLQRFAGTRFDLKTLAEARELIRGATLSGVVLCEALLARFKSGSHMFYIRLQYDRHMT